mgnify:CR=1 FL=1
MYNVYVEIYGESLMLQEYLEEQLLTPIRSKVRQDVGLEEPNSRLRRSLVRTYVKQASGGVL